MNSAAREAAWGLVWSGKDVTADLKPYVVSIRYTDDLQDESDELTIELEDRDGLFRGDWFPSRGDLVELTIGYAGESMARMGSFEIDEISFNGPPDMVSVRCLAAGIKAALRTDGDEAWENKTLLAIAADVAQKNGLKLVGSGQATGRVYDRVTRHREAPLAFLNRLGWEEGIIFTVKDRQLVWHDQAELDGAPVAAVIERTAISGYGLTIVASTLYSECVVSYHDPVRKELIKATAKAAGIPCGETLSLVLRCDNADQAQGKADAALRRANGAQLDGQLWMPGDPAFRAGMNIQLQGFSRLDRITQILRVDHGVTRSSGFTTSVSVGIPSEQEAYQ